MRASRLVIILSLTAFSLQREAWSKERTATALPRSLMYAYEQTDSLVTVNVYTNLSGGVHGEVVLFRLSPTREVLRKPFTMSKAEFEQVWSTLDAPGIEKHRITPQNIKLDNDYIFQAGNDWWAVRKASPTPVVSALASRLRSHADAVIKSGMTPLPFTRVTPTPRPR